MSKQEKVSTAYEVASMAPDDVRGVAMALANELEFMRGTLEQLRAHIAEHGPVEWYQNGRQECWRESPAMKSYNAMVPRYGAIYKQLLGLLPADVATEAGDELDQWLKEN